MPDCPTILIANELLDALPFRQWIKANDVWQERAVGLMDGKLVFTTRPATLDPAVLPSNHGQQPDGTIFETAPSRTGLITAIADHLAAHNGSALFIDYGHLESGFGDTFQAVKDHAYVPPLSAPGTADLTNHVDFAPLLTTAQNAGCTAPYPVTQGEFLLSLGLLERAGALGSGQEKPVQNTLRDAVERLAGPNQMGNLFKAMTFSAHPT